MRKEKMNKQLRALIKLLLSKNVITKEEYSLLSDIQEE